MDLYNEKNALSFTLKMDTQVLKSLVLCTGALGVKYLVSVLATVIPNRLCGEASAEDLPLLEKILGKDFDKEMYRSIQKRCACVVSNDQESIPVGLAMLWLAGLVTSTSATSSESSQSVVRLTQVFTLSRLAHSTAYYFGVPGVRSLAFLGGSLSVSS